MGSRSRPADAAGVGVVTGVAIGPFARTVEGLLLGLGIWCSLGSLESRGGNPDATWVARRLARLTRHNTFRGNKLLAVV